MTGVFRRFCPIVLLLVPHATVTRHASPCWTRGGCATAGLLSPPIPVAGDHRKQQRRILHTAWKSVASHRASPHIRTWAVLTPQLAHPLHASFCSAAQSAAGRCWHSTAPAVSSWSHNSKQTAAAGAAAAETPASSHGGSSRWSVQQVRQAAGQAAGHATKGAAETPPALLLCIGGAGGLAMAERTMLAAA